LTVRAVIGLFLLNGFLLAVGLGVLFAIRGWRSWGELARLAGLAYLLGVGSCGVVWVLELVVGVPFTLATIVLTGAAVMALGAGAGWRIGRRLPARPRVHSLAPWSVATAVFAGATVIVFEALFRAGRIRGLSEYDALRSSACSLGACRHSCCGRRFCWRSSRRR
jgi:hypothetical protein